MQGEMPSVAPLPTVVCPVHALDGCNGLIVILHGAYDRELLLIPHCADLALRKGLVRPHDTASEARGTVRGLVLSPVRLRATGWDEPASSSSNI